MKMPVRNKMSSLFVKYLLSYMAILIIPLVFTSIFIFGYFNKILTNEVTNSNLAMMTHVKDVLDDKIWGLNEISNQISRNSKLAPYLLNKSVSARMDAIRELKNYSTGNDLIDNLVLYIKNTDLLLSGNSTYNTSSFINYVYKYDNWKYEEYLDTINNLSEPLYRYSENVYCSGTNCSQRYVTYLVPGSRSTVLFLIEENKLKSLISAKSDKKDQNTIIADKDANIITSMEDSPYLHLKSFSNLIKRTGSKGTGITIIEKKNYFYSYVKSETNGWIYITLIPEHEALSSVYKVKLETIYGWILIFIIGSCIIYCLTYYNYNPIRNLQKLAEERCGQKIKCNNEIKVVESVIKQMANKELELKESLNYSKTAVKESLLLELLRGQIDSIEKFNLAGKEIGIYFSNYHYMVCLFYSDSFKDIKGSRKLEIIERMESILPDGIEGLGKDGIDERTVIIILSFNDNSEPDIKKTLQNIKNEISEVYKINTTVSAGNICKTTDQIGKSYLEASIAIDYKLILGENKIIFFNEILIKNSNNFIYPEKELKDIQLYIKQGDINCIETSLASIVKNIRESEMPIVMARCICYDIINSVLKTVNEIGISSTMMGKEYFCVEKLNNFSNMDELTDIIKSICSNLCNDMKKSKESQNFDLKNKLIMYIEKYYNDYNFSVKAMADTFGLSPSYLSRFFKDQTGRTISEYQRLLRIDRAKHYLKATNEPIKNIIDMLGYCNEASFVRLFKKSEGITPGEYRRLVHGMQTANNHATSV